MWNVFSPKFTWPYHVEPLADLRMPPLSRPSSRLMRSFWGHVHHYLREFSDFYCRLCGIRSQYNIWQLPFGLVLKWSDGTRLEEVIAMKTTRASGMPVPRVLSYGDHPETPWASVSILMTRVPGETLGTVYESLTLRERQTISDEMRAYLTSMRKWRNPWGESRICSISGTAIRSVRVPWHSMGPFETEQELNEYLIEPAAADTPEKFTECMGRVRRLHSVAHEIVFTHGDFKHHNIMVHNGHVSGFIDWESAGWYPKYWEFTTALKYIREDFWWYDFVMHLGGAQYSEAVDSERALTNLTVGSYVG